MNPFTQFLSQWSRNRQLEEFVAYWDRLERVVVAVYREKMALVAAETEFAEVWPWLRQVYPAWARDLRPFWRATKAAGAPTQRDPFQLLLDKQQPADILGDWGAMQHLPAAREALNQFILSQSR
jgi:hypothetical protein